MSKMVEEAMRVSETIRDGTTLTTVAAITVAVALAMFPMLFAQAEEAKPAAHSVPFEPVENSVQKADLVPCHAFQHSDWAKKPCYLNDNGGRLVLGNGFLELELSTQPSLVLVKFTNKVTGETWNCPKDRSDPFILTGAKGQDISYAKVPDINLRVKAGNFSKVAIEPGKENTDEASSFTAKLTGHSDLEVEMEFRLRRTDHLFSCRTRVKNTGKSNVALLTVEGLAAGKVDGWFLRWRMPLPGPKIVGDGYQPMNAGFLAKPGDSFLTEWLDAVLMPVFTKKEKAMGKRKPIQWSDKAKPWTEEYYDRISEIRKGVHPLVHYQGWYANQVSATDPAFVEVGDKIIGIFHRMGGKTYHTRSWVYSSVGGTTRESRFYKRMLELNKLTREKYGIGLSTGFGWDQSVGRGECILGAVIQEFLADQFDAFEKRGGPQLWGIDFFSGFRPCNDPSHDHFSGEYSIYPQVRSLYMEWIPKFRREHDWMGLYSGPGFWGSTITPSISPHVDAQHLTDGTCGNGCDLHPDRLRADDAAAVEGGHRQSKSISSSRLMGHMGHAGWKYKVNVHDLIGWRYALMRRMAICPNVTYEFISPDMEESEIAFTRSWVDWAGRNADILFERRNLKFENSRVDGYSHIIRDHGFFALVNPGYAPQTVDLSLASLEKPKGGRYAMEIYPEARKLNDGKPLDPGTPLRIELAPMTVMIFRTGTKDYVAQAQPGLGTPPMPRENYLRDWKAETEGNETIYAASFTLLPSLKAFLPKRDTTTPEKTWTVEPSGFRKVYLVPWIEPLARKRGKQGTQDGVADTVISIQVNGKDLVVHTPQRRTVNVRFRCRFADIGDVLKEGENRVTIRMSSPKGNARFRGAWLDWPQF